MNTVFLLSFFSLFDWCQTFLCFAFWLKGISNGFYFEMKLFMYNHRKSGVEYLHQFRNFQVEFDFSFLFSRLAIRTRICQNWNKIFGTQHSNEKIGLVTKITDFRYNLWTPSVAAQFLFDFWIFLTKPLKFQNSKIPIENFFNIFCIFLREKQLKEFEFLPSKMQTFHCYKLIL